MNVLIYLVYFLLNSFCRTDLKFCSCSDDTTVKVWDFARCQEERSLTGNVSNLLPALVYFFVSCQFILLVDPHMSVFHVFYSHLLEAEKIESLEIEMVAHPSIDL